MKKLLFVVLLIAACSTVNAQTEKGTYLLGGNAIFQSTSGGSSFSMSPNVGYFIVKNVALGARANLFVGENYNSWLFGPFGRFYFGDQPNGKFFGQASVNVGGAKNTDTELGFGIGAGYALFLNQSIALEFAANYDKIGDSKGLFGLGVGFQIHLKK